MTDDLVERIRVQFEEIQGPVLGPPERLEAIKARRDDALRDLAHTAIAECFKWRDINDAPRDGTHILLSTRRGLVEAWFSSGYWTEETPSNAREYNGPVWVCADDTFQIEVEEGPSPGDDNHGEALGWMPLPDPPKEPKP